MQEVSVWSESAIERRTESTAASVRGKPGFQRRDNERMLWNMGRERWGRRAARSERRERRSRSGWGERDRASKREEMVASEVEGLTMRDRARDRAYREVGTSEVFAAWLRSFSHWREPTAPLRLCPAQFFERRETTFSTLEVEFYFQLKTLFQLTFS
ncbi:hypothetical protein U1Q18_004584 [Sarracenia purpurea var. burkii]